jgi:hypothetical protein
MFLRYAGVKNDPSFILLLPYLQQTHLLTSEDSVVVLVVLVVVLVVLVAAFR